MAVGNDAFSPQDAGMSTRPCQRTVGLLLPLLLLPASGCCTMARLFCGPDDSAWVPIAYATPQESVATLLEAIRRDDCGVVVQCLGSAFKKRYGLGDLEAAIAWQKLREQVTGLHLLGYAKPGDPVERAPDAVTFVVEQSGHKVRIDLAREGFREVVYERPNGTVGDWCETFAPPMLAIESTSTADIDQSRMFLAPVDIEHEGLKGLPLSAIRSAGIRWQWKVADLRTLDP